MDYCITNGELYHAGGWEKKGHKYIKRERGKNGKWVYYYPTNNTPKNKANKGYTEYETKDGSGTLYVNENAKRLFDKKSTATVSSLTYDTESTVTTLEIGAMTRTLNKAKSFVNDSIDKMTDKLGYDEKEKMEQAKKKVVKAQYEANKTKDEWRTANKAGSIAETRKDSNDLQYQAQLANEGRGVDLGKTTTNNRLRERQSSQAKAAALKEKKFEMDAASRNLDRTRKELEKATAKWESTPAYKIEKAKEWTNNLFNKEKKK